MIRLFVALFLITISTVTAGFSQTKVPETQVEIQLGFAPLVKNASPAVVNIYAKRLVAARQSPFQGDPFFQNLFRDFGTMRPQVQNSLGSGVILTAEGIVVSNYHVVGMATDIRVVLNDRREFAARVLLADEDSDLALLQLEQAPDAMPHLNLRDSDTVDVGELVLAIGNPFGVGQTVSSGIVSGLARSGTAAGAAQGYFLQTDAPINPGNSGGALIDINGDLIGINTRILTRSGGSNGIGFAIPANLVAQFVKQAEAGFEQFQRPWAGATGQPVDADMAESLGLDRPGGIVIASLHRASPLRQAGVGVGDVILAVDGRSVNTGAEMMFRMSVAGLDSDVDLSVLRATSGKIATITTRLVAPPEVPARDTKILNRRSTFPEMQLSNINPAVIAQYRLDLSADGVLVEAPGALGAQLGLQPGDIVRRVNSSELKDTRDATKALRNLTGRITLVVERAGRQILLRFRR